MAVSMCAEIHSCVDFSLSDIQLERGARIRKGLLCDRNLSYV